mmetsp:Transcript_4805/g.12283  ORF Transcript_4805/g.12283 Transcript_4805/m.12283 type:complete len:241 (-) Transcript_4805:225-947(-)
MELLACLAHEQRAEVERCAAGRGPEPPEQSSSAIGSNAITGQLVVQIYKLIKDMYTFYCTAQNVPMDLFRCCTCNGIALLRRPRSAVHKSTKGPKEWVRVGAFRHLSACKTGIKNIPRRTVLLQAPSFNVQAQSATDSQSLGQHQEQGRTRPGEHSNEIRIGEISCGSIMRSKVLRGRAKITLSSYSHSKLRNLLAGDGFTRLPENIPEEFTSKACRACEKSMKTKAQAKPLPAHTAMDL